MKFLVHLSGLALALICTTTTTAQTYTWTGSADSLWSNASNWSGASGYPDNSNHNVVFNNSTVPTNIELTENIDVGTFTWEVKQSRGVNLNGFDLTVNGTASFTASTKYSPSKTDGQLIFSDNVDFSTNGTYNLYNFTTTSGTMTVGSQSKLTIKSPSTKVDISMNDLTLNDDSKLIVSNSRNLDIVDLTVGDFCILEFPRNKTTTVSGTATLDQPDCTTFSTYRSVKPGTQAKLKFTGGAATGDFNVYEDISITTSGGGNTFTANNHTDLGNNSSISGTTRSAVACAFDGNGNTTGDWSDATEWDCSCAPRPVDDVTINSGNTVDIDLEHVLCDDLTFAASTSRISSNSGDRLEVHGNLTTAGTDNFVEHLGTTEFRNDVTGTTETLECSGCDTVKFYGSVIFEFPGNTWQLSDHVRVQDDNDKNRGDFTVDEGTLDANNFNIESENDFKVNSSGTLTMGTGEVRCIDANKSVLSIAGSGTLYNLVIDKSSTSDLVELQTNIVVTNQLDLSNTGIITMQNSTDTLILNDGATVTGANNNSHVNSYMKKVGNDNFTFPIGNGTYYRPVGVTDMPGNSTVTDELFAVYYNANPFDSGMVWTSWESSINNVNTREYWDISNLVGSPTPKIILSWDSPNPSGSVSNVSEMTVAHWTGTEFEDLGQGSNTGNTTSGTVTSSLNTTGFSPFTTGSTGSGNTLPVELTDFYGHLTPHGVELNWVTMTEINVDYFEVERSEDADYFELVGMETAAGNSKHRLEYDLLDDELPTETVYYRLKMVDLDGTYEYSRVIQMTPTETNGNLTPVFPNPATAGQTIRLDLAPEGPLMLCDLQGRPIQTLTGSWGQPAYALPDGLTPGVYLLQSPAGPQQVKARVVVR